MIGTARTDNLSADGELPAGISDDPNCAAHTTTPTHKRSAHSDISVKIIMATSKAAAKLG